MQPIICPPVSIFKLFHIFRDTLNILVKYRTYCGLFKLLMRVYNYFRYKEAVLGAQRILTDQPLKGTEKAVWWIEYVIRHQDVSHLKSPATKMSFIEYLMLDVMLFLFVISIVTLYVSIKTVNLLCLISRFSSPNSSNKLKDN